MSRPLLDAYLFPSDLQAAIESELGPNETLLWAGQPSPKRVAKRDLPLVLFAVPWTGFAVFWTLGAAGLLGQAGAGGSLGFAAFGLPFIAIGLGMFATPWWSYRVAKRTAYVITEERAIILRIGRRSDLQAFPADRLTVLKRRTQPDGSGDLILERESSTDSDGHRDTKEIGFFGIPEVKEVGRLVRDVAAAHQIPGRPSLTPG
ncbi:MAG: hypothetical protein AAF288_09990 [Planctomycetota bacterium]